MSLDNIAKYSGKLLIFLLLQVLVLNNINLTALGLTPYLYIVFIMLLPFETSKGLLLGFAFGMGMLTDIFDDTGGLHASALLLAAFARPLVLRVLSPRDGYETGTRPRVMYYGIAWFLKYTLLMVFLHHIVYFYLEVFSFGYFFYTLLVLILNTIFSSILILMSQYLIFRK